MHVGPTTYFFLPFDMNEQPMPSFVTCIIEGKGHGPTHHLSSLSEVATFLSTTTSTDNKQADSASSTYFIESISTLISGLHQSLPSIWEYHWSEKWEERSLEIFFCSVSKEVKSHIIGVICLHFLDMVILFMLLKSFILATVTAVPDLLVAHVCNSTHVA